MHPFGKNKLYAYWWKLSLRTQALNDMAFLQAAAPSITHQNLQVTLNGFLDELKNFTELRETITTYQKVIRSSFDDFILGPQIWFPLFYAILRLKKPEIVIETGCCTGTTTSLILYALQQNQRGHLYSIDMRFPDDWLSTGQLETGFLVPENLKSRWSLILGDTKVELPKLLATLGKVDLFYHDADHSYVYQMWKYLTAWPYIPVGGVLASDDIRHNTSFFDFGRQVPSKPLITQRGTNFGVLVK